MIEVEIKVPIDDKNTIIKKLINIGFIFKKTIKQSDIYFQHPTRDFAKSDEALRIRRTLDGCYLNYKGPKLDKTTKTREEIEIFLKESENITKIFEKLGFKKVFIVEKTREIYKFNEITASIDSVKSLGTFMELEILIKEDKDLSENREKVFSILKKMNISKEKIIRKSYLELILFSSIKGREKIIKI